MRGTDLKGWRKRNGYTQEALMRELQLRSRQTLVGWEQSEKVSRTVELALQALERLPDTRTIAGLRCSPGTSHRLEACEAQELLDDSLFGRTTDQPEALGNLISLDPMTGIYNRRHFLQLAEFEFAECKRYERPLSFMLLDIDLFKSINDRFGHPVGDQLIVQVANICKDFCRNSGIAARFGAEEFSVLLPGTTLDAAHALAEQLRQHIGNRHFLAGSQSIQATVSIGVAELTSETPNISAVAIRADQALYVAKIKGRNRVARVPFEPKNASATVAA